MEKEKKIVYSLRGLMHHSDDCCGSCKGNEKFLGSPVIHFPQLLVFWAEKCLKSLAFELIAHSLLFIVFNL